MRRITVWLCLLLIALAGCQSDSQGTLNDKKLTKQDHIKGAYPRYYEPVEKKEAEAALPFSLKMPKEFPFKVMKTTYQISDWGEKRNIMLETVFYPIQEGQNVYLSYRITNFLPSDEKIKTKESTKLASGVKAYYSGNADLPILSWEDDGLYYKMEYLIMTGTDFKKEKRKLEETASSIYE
jgi:hypothetical protein